MKGRNTIIPIDPIPRWKVASIEIDQDLITMNGNVMFPIHAKELFRLKRIKTDSAMQYSLGEEFLSVFFSRYMMK